MTDRELLEAAARAAGYEIAWADGPNHDPVKAADNGQAFWEPWNPLTDDGDALRLAVKLGIGVNFDLSFWSLTAYEPHPRDGFHTETADGPDFDPYAATRRAIVRAAAAIGEAM